MSSDSTEPLIEKLEALNRIFTRGGEQAAIAKCIAIVRENAATERGWQPLETAPVGYDGKKFNHVLFRGVSKARSFSGPVYVSGWMDNNRKPVHEYAYKLIITGWKPLSVVEPEAA